MNKSVLELKPCEVYRNVNKQGYSVPLKVLNHHHHHHNPLQANTESDHLLTRLGLTRLEVS
jgi:hypothetical protein